MEITNKNYSQMRNKNRGYLKLEVWQKAMELFKLIWKTVYWEVKIDYKLHSQITDSAQSVKDGVMEHS